MKYLCSLCIWILCADICFAEKAVALARADFLVPHDVSEALLANRATVQKVVKNDYVDPYDIGNEPGVNQSDSYVDPYDLPIMKNPEKNPKRIVRKKEKKQAEKETKKESVPNSGLLIHADSMWQSWKSTHIVAPKPALDWSQVGLEAGVGYVGAFGGSVIGLFSGFLVGSIYDGVTKCEQCWVNIAISMSTIGATLGATSSVYLMGNNDEQLGSALATYSGTLIPVLIGAVAYRNSKQLGRSGFYLATMPLFAVAGYNLSRYFRKKGEKALFENFFIDDVWVSKGRDNVLAANIRLTF